MLSKGKCNVCAVIVAGGQGKRFVAGYADNKKCTHKKQFVSVAGMPLLYWTISAFQGCCIIDSIVIVLPAGDIDLWAGKIMRKFNKVVGVVPGGTNRVVSVTNGLSAVPVNTGIVAIQDGVRPLVTADAVMRCVKTAARYGACIIASPSKDTVKLVDKDGVVTQTLDRRKVWRAETPQVFKKSVILNAYAKLGTRVEVTDDAQVVELAGEKVRIIDGECLNLKVTTKEDIRIVEPLLRKRK